MQVIKQYDFEKMGLGIFCQSRKASVSLNVLGL